MMRNSIRMHPHIHNTINRITRIRIHIRVETHVVIIRIRIRSRVRIRIRSRGRTNVLVGSDHIIIYRLIQRTRSRGSTSRTRTRIRIRRGVAMCIRVRIRIVVRISNRLNFTHSINGSLVININMRIRLTIRIRHVTIIIIGIRLTTPCSSPNRLIGSIIRRIRIRLSSIMSLIISIHVRPSIGTSRGLSIRRRPIQGHRIIHNHSRGHVLSTFVFAMVYLPVACIGANRRIRILNTHMCHHKS